MLSFALRSSILALATWAVCTGFFAWRWPATWRLPVRTYGTTNQPDDPARSASDDLAQPSPAIGWVVLIGVMALLFVGWLLLVLLT